MVYNSPLVSQSTKRCPLIILKTLWLTDSIHRSTMITYETYWFPGQKTKGHVVQMLSDSYQELILIWYSNQTYKADWSWLEDNPNWCCWGFLGGKGRVPLSFYWKKGHSLPFWGLQPPFLGQKKYKVRLQTPSKNFLDLLLLISSTHITVIVWLQSTLNLIANFISRLVMARKLPLQIFRTKVSVLFLHAY